MKSIESHIAKDKDILDDPSTNPQMRRHIEVELHELEDYVDHHKEEIEAGDHHDPNCFCLLYTSPSPRDNGRSRIPSSA